MVPIAPKFPTVPVVPVFVPVVGVLEELRMMNGSTVAAKASSTVIAIVGRRSSMMDSQDTEGRDGVFRAFSAYNY